MPRLVLALVAVVAAAGCEDVDSPAELDHAQVLALSATPARIPFGDSAVLDLLVAGPDGDIEPSSVDWSVETGAGSVFVEDGVAFYRAPAGDSPTTVWLFASIALSTGEHLAAEKLVSVGEPPLAPPVIRSVFAGEDDMTESMQLPPNQSVEVSIDVDSAARDGDLTTWHTTCGSFERYRQPRAMFDSGESCSGQLYAVYRDGAGGVAWIRVPLLVGGRSQLLNRDLQ